MLMYFVAFFKLVDGKLERVEFQTFYSTLQRAKVKAFNSFDDEAGYYNGILIEAKEEENPFFHGQKFWYALNEKGELEEITEPENYKNIYNII